MNFQQRLQIAIAAMGGRDLIGEKAERAFKAQEQSFLTAQGGVRTPDVKFEALVQHGWRRNELIFACVSKKANTASQVQTKIMSGESEIENHPLKKLLSKPNPYMTEFEFWSTVVVLLDFAGNAYFEKVRSNAGRTAELWPMRPDWINVEYDSDGNPTGYTYNIPARPPIFYAYEDILTFKLYDPLNEFFGYPPVAVAARVGDVDNSATDYVRLLFQEGGVPPGILTSKQPINDITAHRIRQLYREQYGGYTNWDAPMVLGYDTQYQKTGLGIQEMGLEILDRRAEVRICMTLHVPPILISSRIGLERAIQSNVREFHRAWWDDDLMPLYKQFADTINENLSPEYGDGIVMEWDFENVTALQEDKEEKAKRALEAFKAGAITRNEYYEMIGFDNIGPVGDVYVMSAAMMEVPAGALIYDPEEEEPEEEEPEEEIEEEEDDDDGAEDDEEEDVKFLRKSANSPDDAVRRKQESETEENVEQFFTGTLGRIEKSITNVYPRE